MVIKKSSIQASANVQEIPLKLIVADPRWNVRSAGFTGQVGTEPTEHGNDWPDFVNSIRVNGQQDPCDVRPVKGGKFELVAGFKRFAAVAQIAAESKNKDATLLCLIKDYTDAQARLRNVTENAVRDDLSLADAVYGAGLAKRALLDAGEYVDDKTSVAPVIGKSQGVTQKYLVIAEKLKPALIAQWRQSKAPLGLMVAYEIAKLDRDKQEEAWAEVTTLPQNDEAGGKAGPSNRVKAEAAGKRFGAFLAQMVREGVVSEDAFSDINWAAAMGGVVSVGVKKGQKGPSKADWGKAAEAAEKEYEEGIAPAPEPAPAGK